MSNINIKNLECLCVKNASAKSISAAGAIVKAKISGTSTFRSYRGYGYGKISSTKTVTDKQFKYRVMPPAGSELTVDNTGPIYRIYILPTRKFDAPPRTGDTVVLGDYDYIVQKVILIYSERFLEFKLQ